MKIHQLKNFTGGWFIGNFEPTLIKTKNFEVSVKYYKLGDVDDTHFHKIADEYTVIVSGKYQINGQEYGPGMIIHFEPNDVSRFVCTESGATAVVKIPSVKGDKYILNE